eukprot:5123578-Alexandrium_andersonii.AAC.1
MAGGSRHDRMVRQSGDEGAAPTTEPLGANVSRTDSPLPVRRLPLRGCYRAPILAYDLRPTDEVEAPVAGMLLLLRSAPPAGPLSRARL